MKRTKRWLMLLVGVTLTLLLLAPVGIGLLITQQLPLGVKNLDQQIGQYELTLSALQRGWLSSSGTILVGRADGRALFSYPFRLRHGLMNLSPGWVRGDGEIFTPSDLPMGALSFSLGLTGNLQVNLALTALSGFDGELRLSHSLFEQRFELASDGFSGEGFKQLSGFVKTDDKPGAYRLQAQLKRISGPGWSVDGITADGVFASDNNFADVTLNATTDAWTRPGMAAFEKSSAKIALSHLSVPVLSQALRLRDTQSALALLPALLELMPVIDNFQLTLDHPLGSAQSGLSGYLVRPPAAGFIADTSRLLAVLALEADWAFSETLAVAWTAADYLAAGATRSQAQRYSRARWDQIRAGAWIRSDGSTLLGELVLGDGVLSVNNVILN